MSNDLFPKNNDNKKTSDLSKKQFDDVLNILQDGEFPTSEAGTYSTAATSADPEHNKVDFDSMVKAVREFESDFEKIKKETIKSVLLTMMIPDGEFWIVDYEEDKYLILPTATFEKLKEQFKNGLPSDLEIKGAGFPYMLGTPVIHDESLVWKILCEKMGLSPSLYSQALLSGPVSIQMPDEKVDDSFNDSNSWYNEEYLKIARESSLDQVGLVEGKNMFTYIGVDHAGSEPDKTVEWWLINGKRPSLKPYIAFSGALGARDGGAVLVLAHNAREAKAVVWGECSVIHDITGDDYTDLRVLWMRQSEYLYDDANKEKLLNNIPHAVDDATYCKECECWGRSRIGEDKLCDFCRRGEYDHEE